ncbi:hypothetical protein [Candidatus Cyanaurora vandensis]|uniref:hypothetical protein n=1 Tax=Candidatus Cyanaurora vandensis TaxID=2714958 RepID=UPI00257D72B8|nr:hypothetical protein [Candidatus Cyanaurora vandensis]
MSSLTPVHRRALALNGLLILVLLGLGGLLYRSLLQLTNYYLQQQTHTQQLALELDKAQRVYQQRQRRFERAFDGTQRSALLKERYGLVHPQDRPVKWEQPVD